MIGDEYIAMSGQRNYTSVARALSGFIMSDGVASLFVSGTSLTACRDPENSLSGLVRCLSGDGLSRYRL